MKPSFALIGPGKVGCAVSRRLHLATYPLIAIVSRTIQQSSEACEFIGCSTQLASTELNDCAAADIILLAVADDQIAELAINLIAQANFKQNTTLIHFSGLHPAAIMRNAPCSASLLSLHPLLPFASRELAVKSLSGCPCALEGDNDALALGHELIAALGGQPFSIPSEKKALYHASACIASNFLVTLLGQASVLLESCGIDRHQGMALLLPLVHATLDNATNLGPEQGLTGPIVRGDQGTVLQHLQALQNQPETLAMYQQLGKLTTALALRSGRLETLQAQELLESLGDCKQ